MKKSRFTETQIVSILVASNNTWPPTCPKIN